MAEALVLIVLVAIAAAAVGLVAGILVAPRIGRLMEREDGSDSDERERVDEDRPG